MTTILPNIETAMIPAITRGAISGPKTAPKKTVAMSSLQLSSIIFSSAIMPLIKVELNLLIESLIDKH